jgi:hypothetical protein
VPPGFCGLAACGFRQLPCRFESLKNFAFFICVSARAHECRLALALGLLPPTPGHSPPDDGPGHPRAHILCWYLRNIFAQKSRGLGQPQCRPYPCGPGQFSTNLRRGAVESAQQDQYRYYTGISRSRPVSSSCVLAAVLDIRERGVCNPAYPVWPSTITICEATSTPIPALKSNAVPVTM